MENPMQRPATPPGPGGQGPMDVERIRRERQLREQKERQSLGRGLIGGIVGAVVGAVLWAIITAVTGYQIGWMAVGVGFLTGYGVRALGKGVEAKFGYVGAVLSLLGCVTGNLLAVCIILSQRRGVSLLEVLSRLDLDMALAILKATFHPLDLLFYGIGIYEGYKFSFAPPTDEGSA